MEPPSTDEEVKPVTLEDVLDGGPSFHCDLCDTEIVHKIAQAMLPALASACVDNTMDGLFRSPASVAVDIRKEMVEYLLNRSENFVAESVVLEGGADIEVSDHPFDIISDFIDDFASAKRNFFSRVSGWLLSDRREDRIDDFVQEMEINGFWFLERREAIAQSLLKNVDFKNIYHCDNKFSSEEEVLEHVQSCSFRIMECLNEGCDSRFSAAQNDIHDSVCPFKILPCEQRCSESIMRRDMDRHCITVCPMKLVNCTFFPAGCPSLVPKSTLDEHRSENLQSHLVCVLKTLHKEATVKSLEKRAEELEKLANPGRLTSARDARSLTYAIKDLEAKLGPVEVIEEEDDDANEGNDEKQDKPDEYTQNEESTELPDKKEEHLDPSPKHIGTTDKPSEMEKQDKPSDDTNEGNDEKQDKPDEYTQNKESTELPDKKEEHLDPSPKHIGTTDKPTEMEKPASSDFSPENGPVSSSNQEENMKSKDVHLIVDESLVTQVKELESTKEKGMPHEPATKEEYIESRMVKDDPSGSPNKEDKSLSDHSPKPIVFVEETKEL